MNIQLSDYLPYVMILNFFEADVFPPKYVQIINMSAKTMLKKKKLANICKK